MTAVCWHFSAMPKLIHFIKQAMDTNVTMTLHYHIVSEIKNH